MTQPDPHDPFGPLRAAFAAGSARSLLAGMEPVEAATCVRRALLDPTTDLEALAAALPPVRLPLLDEPAAAASLAEEAILLGADPDEMSPAQGEVRLGWSLAADGRLVPVHALAWRKGTPECPWDLSVRCAYDWLRSPNRILALSPQLLRYVQRANPTEDGVLPLDRRLGPIAHALRRGPTDAASKHDDLAELLDRAGQPPGPEERLHAVLLAHGEELAPALAQAAVQSLFFGADPELWAARLELLLPGGANVAWSLRAGDGRPRLLHVRLAKALRDGAPDWSLNEDSERWLHTIAAESGMPGMAARSALSAHRRPWFRRLPPEARDETLRALASTEVPLPGQDWILRGAQEGLDSAEVDLAAGAWRLRSITAEPAEHLALLGALALPALDNEERRGLVEQAVAAPDHWRIGVVVTLIQAAARAHDSALVDELAALLETYARGGRVAVAAAVGLLQLVRQGSVTPKDHWVARIRATVKGPVASDPRVQRELDRAG